MKLPFALRCLAGSLVLSGLASSASAAVLFSDTFNRANGTDLNATTTGKSGDLGALNWGSNSFESLIDINSNALRINNDNSDGNDGSWAWVEHNFVGLSTFTVTMDITAQSSGGNGRYVGFRVGQTVANISGEANAATSGNAADVQVYLDAVGSLRGIRVYEGTADQGYVYNNPSTPVGELSAVFTYANQNAGTTLNYEVFLDGISRHVGSTTWSGTDENYISLQSNSTNNTLIDTFTVEGTVVPEPSAFALLGLGLFGLASRRRRA